MPADFIYLCLSISPFAFHSTKTSMPPCAAVMLSVQGGTYPEAEKCCYSKGPTLIAPEMGNQPQICATECPPGGPERPTPYGVEGDGPWEDFVLS